LTRLWPTTYRPGSSAEHGLHKAFAISTSVAPMAIPGQLARMSPPARNVSIPLAWRARYSPACTQSMILAVFMGVRATPPGNVPIPAGKRCAKSANVQGNVVFSRAFESMIKGKAPRSGAICVHFECFPRKTWSWSPPAMPWLHFWLVSCAAGWCRVLEAGRGGAGWVGWS